MVVDALFDGVVVLVVVTVVVDDELSTLDLALL